MLRPGGHCFILVPNFRIAATRLLGKRYRYILPQHINYFTHRTLRLLAPPALEEVYYISTHFNPVVIAQDFRRRPTPEASERTQPAGEDERDENQSLAAGRCGWFTLRPNAPCSHLIWPTIA